MELDIKPGRYVAAISGGVDSMVLLDLLIKHSDLQIVVAHFNHGIRDDSLEDELLVKRIAKKNNLEFVCEQGHLGSTASEAVAREARYKFLRNVMDKYRAKAIITAHHQDDLIETMFLNVIRGTRRKGLTPFDSQADIIRPLLAYSKHQLVDYAMANNIVWHEDSTNSDQKYRRNYLRHSILNKVNPDIKNRIIELNHEMRLINQEIDLLIRKLVKSELDRPEFNALPFDVSCEVMAAWLRQKGLTDFDSKNIEKLVVAAKTKPSGKKVDAIKGWSMLIGKTTLALEPSDC